MTVREKIEMINSTLAYKFNAFYAFQLNAAIKIYCKYNNILNNA